MELDSHGCLVVQLANPTREQATGSSGQIVYLDLLEMVYQKFCEALTAFHRERGPAGAASPQLEGLMRKN